MYRTRGRVLFTVNLLAVGGPNYGPQVTAFGYIGGGEASPEAASDLKVPWHDAVEGQSELSLLSWHTRLSDFTGRDKQMKELDDWAASDPAVRMKFVTGRQQDEGGVGKSRLAAEFAESLKGKGWAAGFVDLRKSQTFPMNKAGTLLIVDYPEENRNAVRELFCDLAGMDKSQRVRVLFLSRQPLESWLPIIEDSGADDIHDPIPTIVERMSPADAHKLFLSAQEKAAELRGSNPPPLSEEILAEWLRHQKENDRALFVLAAAVYTAIYPDDHVVQYSGPIVVDALVKRELKRLRNIARGAGLEDELGFARLLAMATLADELPLKQIKELVKNPDLQLGFAEDTNVKLTLKYTGVLSDDIALALQPDIVAAAFVVKVLAEDQEIAPELIWAALENDLEGGLDRFARLSYDAEIALGILDDRLSKWLPDAVAGNPDRCELIQPFVNREFLHIGLIDTAIAVWKTLLENADDDRGRAGLLVNLSVFQSRAGDNQSALATIREGVEVWRRLVARSRSEFEDGLATALNSLSNSLSDDGVHEEAMAVIREAIAICRRLAKSDPERHGPHLALVLANLSALQSRQGFSTKALSTGRDALKIYRLLSKNDAVSYERYLAGCLVNISIYLRADNKWAEALRTVEEAVDILRRLAVASPARYESSMPAGLYAFADCLTHFGRNEEVRLVIEEILDVQRRLANSNPARYEPDLASSLSNLSKHLCALNEWTQALGASREGTKIYRRLAEADSECYEPRVAWSLGMEGNVLDSMGRPLEAAEAYREGLDLVRPHANNAPNGFPAKCLKELLSDLRRVEGRLSESK
ncbi:MAG: tetratricopeptide repeat protein [candidate division Zixibacteria bacterium]|nr:tetratricopeptide repeat protein [candidate division Zixibacteria bacterium]